MAKCCPTFLWPYALHVANAALNVACLPKEHSSPMELFSNVQVMPNAKHAHTFGCPDYILNCRMQDGHKIPNWEECSQVGVYLGPSWAYAKLVGLILSLTTGLVSPQFHACYDNSFESVKRLKLSDLQWQVPLHRGPYCGPYDQCPLHE